MSVNVGRPVRLPFDFGDIVYHRVHADRKPGMVTGFIVRDATILVLVTWADNVQGEATHRPYELTTEFEPNFSQEN